MVPSKSPRNRIVFPSPHRIGAAYRIWPVSVRAVARRFADLSIRVAEQHFIGPHLAEIELTLGAQHDHPAGHKDDDRTADRGALTSPLAQHRIIGIGPPR